VGTRRRRTERKGDSRREAKEGVVMEEVLRRRLRR